MKKVWLVTKIILIVLATILALILCGALGPIVKWGAPVVAKTMGAEVQIEECVILPLGGYVRISGVRVENPASFREKNAEVYANQPLAQIGNLEVDFGMRSLFGDEYIVDKLELTGLRALYAFDYDTTNVDALVAEMGLDAEEPVSEEIAEEVVEAKTEAAKPSKEKKDVVVRLGEVRLEDNSVTIRTFLTLPVAFPPIVMKDVDSRDLMTRINELLAPLAQALKGVGEGLGAGVGALSDTINTSVETVTEGLGTSVEAVTEGLNSGLGATADALDGSVDATLETLGSATESLGDGVKEIGRGAKESVKELKNLFK